MDYMFHKAYNHLESTFLYLHSILVYFLLTSFQLPHTMDNGIVLI